MIEMKVERLLVDDIHGLSRKEKRNKFPRNLMLVALDSGLKQYIGLYNANMAAQ